MYVGQLVQQKTATAHLTGLGHEGLQMQQGLLQHILYAKVYAAHMTVLSISAG